MSGDGARAGVEARVQVVGVSFLGCLLSFRGWSAGGRCLLGAYVRCDHDPTCLFVSTLSHFAFALAIDLRMDVRVHRGCPWAELSSEQSRSQGRGTNVTVTEEDEAGGMAVSNGIAHPTAKPRCYLDVEMPRSADRPSLVLTMVLTMVVFLAPCLGVDTRAVCSCLRRASQSIR